MEQIGSVMGKGALVELSFAGVGVAQNDAQRLPRSRSALYVFLVRTWMNYFW